MTAVLAAVGVTTLVSGFIVIGTAGAVQADDTPVAPNDHQIAICHATGGGKYSIPYPAKKQISDDNGHRSGGGVHPGDIIPPFPAGGEGGSAWGAFGGQNWDSAGQEIYANGCGTPADKRVSPVYPTVEPPTCERDGYLEVPGEQPPGVVVVLAGATDGAGPGTYTFSYAAAEGYILVGDDEVTVTVLPKLTGPQCGEARPLEIPAAPQVIAPTCEAAGSYTLPTDTGDLDWSISPTYTGVGDYTVRVDALGGKKFTDGTTYKTWPISVQPKLTGPQCEPPRLTIPAAPQVSAPTCDVAGSYTLPADTGDLDWSISPTYTGVGDYTVRVDALGGKKFTDGTTYKTWPISVQPKLTGPQCEDDETPPPPVKDVCTNIKGVQPDVPKGYTEQDGICTEVEVLPTVSTDVCSNINGAQAAVPAGLEAQDGKCVRPAEEKPDEVVGPDEVAGTAGAVPTAVDAGIGGPSVTPASTSSPLGQGLVGAGLVMLLLAGALQMGRARGAHQV